MQVALVRPNFELDREFHSEKLKDVTVLICQRKTKDLVQLTIESLLSFYPDINILVIDGNSQDNSTLYLRYKSITHPNIKVVELNEEIIKEHKIVTNAGVNSHGSTMNYALKNHVKTKYFLLMDSDVITERGGFIEGMKTQLEAEGLYAIGTLMLVSKMYQACRLPVDDTDVLRYAHPSCSLYETETYLKLVPFEDHGAPCVWNMIDAERKELKIGYYPIDKYVSHLSGASWTTPRTIWSNDHDVKLRPFVTFITEKAILSNQTDHDFDVVTPGVLGRHYVIQHRDLVKREVNNRLYDIRYNVHGEYVCHLPDMNVADEFVHLIKLQAIEEKAPDEMIVGGLLVIKRTAWQQKHCFG